MQESAHERNQGQWAWAVDMGIGMGMGVGVGMAMSMGMGLDRSMHGGTGTDVDLPGLWSGLASSVPCARPWLWLGKTRVPQAVTVLRMAMGMGGGLGWAVTVAEALACSLSQEIETIFFDLDETLYPYSPALGVCSCCIPVPIAFCIAPSRTLRSHRPCPQTSRSLVGLFLYVAIIAVPFFCGPRRSDVQISGVRWVCSHSEHKAMFLDPYQYPVPRNGELPTLCTGSVFPLDPKPFPPALSAPYSLAAFRGFCPPGADPKKTPTARDTVRQRPHAHVTQALGREGVLLCAGGGLSGRAWARPSGVLHLDWPLQCVRI